MTERRRSILQASEMRALRLILGVTRWDRYRNVYIRERLNVRPVNEIIEKGQLRWFGHVLRMADERDVKRIYNWRPETRRPVGRPRNDWKRTIKQIVEKAGIDLMEAEDLALNRERWRRFVFEFSTDGPNGPPGDW